MRRGRPDRGRLRRLAARRLLRCPGGQRARRAHLERAAHLGHPCRLGLLPEGARPRLRPDGGRRHGGLPLDERGRPPRRRHDHHGGHAARGAPHWLTYFAVDDTDSVVDALVKAEGNVLVPPFDFVAGRMAVVQDPQGVVFAVIKPVPM
ncbi:VOC family protein [Streptomyces sp. NPDC048527]|uniref:VOC family protein n=1 Tax=Streptomyces sp. NPDC048527 TaxID=3365568 RepID=UPI0037223B8B